MRFSCAATLFYLSSLTQAAPSIHGHKHLHPKDYPYNAAQYESGIFYTNWAIYARKHFVTDLPASKLTTINYAFANISATTGEVFLSDTWADTQFPYPGDVASNGTQLLGNFNQLFKLKKAHRNLKVVLSVGGWGFRKNFSPGLRMAEGRKMFCESSLGLIRDLGLDGLDVDWEYPEDEADAENLLDTVRRCRKLFDTYSAQHANSYHFTLSISAPAGPERYTALPIALMDPYIDTWNLMAFDYQGPGFSNYTGHLSNVYPSTSNPKSTDGWQTTKQSFTPFNTRDAIAYYKQRVEPRKIVLGMPLYGRSFANVADSNATHGMGAAFNGSGDGTWEPGTLDVKTLPQNGSRVFTDTETLASWSWDAARREVVSFDTPEVARLKAEYLKQEGLGGAWWWESSGDRGVGDERSLVGTVVRALGGEQGLKLERNNLYYPESKYDNVRSGRVNGTAWGKY